MTYFSVILYLYLDRTGEKIVYFFPNTQQIFFIFKCILYLFSVTSRILKCFVFTLCSFLHNLKQRYSVFAQGCEEKYSMHGNIS